MVATVVNVLGAIAWSPEIRNLLSLLVGVLVLFGSLYLIIATNIGIRTGMLITLSCFFGWMTLMGTFWWIYGNVGMLGKDPHWVVEEINVGGDIGDARLEEARALTGVEDLPTPGEILDDLPGLADEVIPPDNPDKINVLTLGELAAADPDVAETYHFDDFLGGWELLASSDRQRGDAAATADAQLTNPASGEPLFESSSEYVVRDVFSIGGKPQRTDDSLVGRFTHKLSSVWHWRHPVHYAVVQVQPAVAQEVVPGEAPPSPVIDENAPVISVIMVRDLGDKRFPAGIFTTVFGILFALTCWTLHRRDSVIAQVRAGTSA